MQRLLDGVRKPLDAARTSRLLPAAIFVLIAGLGTGMAFVAYQAEQDAGRTHFQLIADEAVDRVRERVSNQAVSLKAILSFLSADQSEHSSAAFHGFVSSLGVTDRLNSVGYAELIRAGAESGMEVGLKNNYGVDRKVWPATANDVRAPVALIEPFDVTNSAMLGYDMLSESARGDAIRAAMKTNGPHASAPVQLHGETGNEKGFLIFMPFDSPGTSATGSGIRGVVYAAISASSMFTTALTTMPRLPLLVKAEDVTGGKQTHLFTSDDFDTTTVPAALEVDRTLDVQGRTWRMTIRGVPGLIKPENHNWSLALGALSLVLAAALAVAAQAQINATEAARALNAISQKTVEEKDLMLQEMKHRIKNSITRIMAMARQTASSSDSLEAFTESFYSRLQALANAQDLLTRSRWQAADLEEHLLTELKQVFGDQIREDRLSGPAVKLDEQMTQALGLTFHELATNSMKYGALSEEGGDLRIRWRIENAGRKRVLVLDWMETTVSPVAEPERTGLGSRLIAANVEGTLGGQVERRYGNRKLTIVIRVPLRSRAARR